MTVSWWSQPFAPEGSAAAEGIVKQLGRPALDPLTVLVREAVQNSWDARLDGRTVDFDIDVRLLGAETDTWRELLLPGPADESNVDLDRALRPDAAVIVVSDRNTVGLGGPLRAGTKADHHEKADFVQFLRNVGEPSDHKFGGGTYGFGKGIFYRLSKVGAILVDTHTDVGGPAERRLMGAALGHSWYLADRRYTGRHWWGVVAEDDVPDPVLADRAAKIAEILGLRGFGDGRSGTDIVILDADLGLTGPESDARVRTPHEAATFLTSSILWNLWPKLVPDDEGTCIRIRVGVDGSAVPVPDPATVDDLAPFVEALAELRAGRGTPYRRTVPPKNAGSFALGLAAADAMSTRLFVRAARPFDGPSHHIARMRIAELVVDYQPGPPHPDSRFSYGAVFKASEDADELFASAEPPTHDDWVAKGLAGAARGVVIGSRSFISKQLDEKFGFGAQSGGGSGAGLGQLAARLAAVVPARLGTPGSATGGTTERASRNGGDGQGQGTAPGAFGGTERTIRGGRPRIVGAPSLQMDGNLLYLVAPVRIPGADRARTVFGEVEVVIEGGGKEGAPPLGATIPHIIQWRAAVSGEVVSGSSMVLAPGLESDWWLYASFVPDAVVRFRVSQAMNDAG